MSITQDLAELTLGLQYDRVPSEVIREAKRLIVDSLACAIGGFASEPGKICRQLARELGGSAEATILGEKERVGCSAAILANGTMIRYLDYNDSLDISKGPGDLAGTHPSGTLAAAFAVGERVGASGKKLLGAMVAGYEVLGRMVDAFATGVEVLGFHHGSVIPYGAAAIAGKLLGLNVIQITHAMGIAGSTGIGLDILDAEGEEYTMTKNIADALLAERGALAAFLAKKGLTGPERVIEGNKGFAHAVLRGVENYTLKPDRGRFWLLDTTMKYFCAESTTQGHLSATTALVKKHQVQPEDIEEVRIRTNKRTVFHTGDPVKKFPTNKETADHSSYFLTAVAILEGKVTPAAYDPSKYNDSRVHRLIEKVHLEHGPEFDAISPAACVTIKTKQGATYSERVDHPKGHPKNRMTDEEVRRKFLECAGPLISPDRVDQIIETFLNLDRVEDIRMVMPLLVM